MNPCDLKEEECLSDTILQHERTQASFEILSLNQGVTVIWKLEGPVSIRESNLPPNLTPLQCGLNDGCPIATCTFPGWWVLSHTEQPAHPMQGQSQCWSLRQPGTQR